MNEITSVPQYGENIVDEQGLPSSDMRLYLDEITQKLNNFLLGSQVSLPSYTVATLPAVKKTPGLIYVSDETGGAVPAFSDGTNWRRVTDRAIVS